MTARGVADDPSGKDHALVAAMRDVASDWAAWTCAERLLAATLLMLIVLVLPVAFLLDGALG